MKRTWFLLIAFAAAAQGELCTARAEEGVTDYEKLIFEATRYATTSEKRVRKQVARETLFELGPKALHETMKRVHARNVMVSVLAQELVGRIPKEQGAPVLAEFLSSTNSDTRRMAAYCLGFYDAPEYTAHVRELLADPEAAGAAIRTLGKWKVRDALDDIRPFLNHEREVRRIAAINALRDIGDPRAIPWIEPCLHDRIFTVRRVAARALTVLRGRE